MLPPQSSRNREARGRKRRSSGLESDGRPLPRLRHAVWRWGATRERSSSCTGRARAPEAHGRRAARLGPRTARPLGAGTRACAEPRAARDARPRLTEPTARPRPVPAAAALTPAPRPGSRLSPPRRSGLRGPVRPPRARRRRRLRRPRRRERRRGRGGDWPAAAPAPIMQRMARH